jgi:hypothetical protein
MCCCTVGSAQGTKPYHSFAYLHESGQFWDKVYPGFREWQEQQQQVEEEEEQQVHE